MKEIAANMAVTIWGSGECGRGVDDDFFWSVMSLIDGGSGLGGLHG